MILIPTGVLMPVESMLIRFSMGYGQALATPGKLTTWFRPGCCVPSGSRQPIFNSSVVIFRSSGQNVAVNGHFSRDGHELKKYLTFRVRHFAGSVLSWTTVSIIDNGAGSVAVSARPILP